MHADMNMHAYAITFERTHLARPIDVLTPSQFTCAPFARYCQTTLHTVKRDEGYAAAARHNSTHLTLQPGFCLLHMLQCRAKRRRLLRDPQPRLLAAAPCLLCCSSWGRHLHCIWMHQLAGSQDQPAAGWWRPAY